MLSSLIDFIFPKTSVISDERLNENNSNQYISDEELNFIDKVSTEDLSDLKRKVNSAFAFSLFAFREGDNFSKIIYQLKYGGMKRLGIYLGELLGKELRNHLKENDLTFDLLIPVPLFKTKVRERGFNQSDFICIGINKELNIQFSPGLVTRVRYTKTQTKLNREQRMNNMKDAFKINKKYENQIDGKRVIVVDDVVTTGSTINEVIKVLEENGCGDIMTCVLAMAR
ncbi:MAG: ComF family protein [Ignavibacteria bacterium]|nr:ComF family protein [Ignavibacteria bacterium]